MKFLITNPSTSSSCCSLIFFLPLVSMRRGLSPRARPASGPSPTRPQLARRRPPSQFLTDRPDLRIHRAPYHRSSSKVLFVWRRSARRTPSSTWPFNQTPPPFTHQTARSGWRQSRPADPEAPCEPAHAHSSTLRDRCSC